MNAMRIVAGSILVVVLLAGCGTVGSLSHFGRDTPIVYGGTRLDVAAINKDLAALERFEADPPAHPKADLPASMILDTLFLPGTLVAATFIFLFW